MNQNPARPLSALSEPSPRVKIELDGERLARLLAAVELADDDGEDETPAYFEPDPIPVDPDGFVVAYDHTQQEEIKRCFERYGCVVVRNVLSPSEVPAFTTQIFYACAIMYIFFLVCHFYSAG